ncbi:hypothetical protein TNCV_4103101 [Trichonephila clavipes]|nr:hypothetical protein TNCV_4103101 [Trichonephila clavipes]
MFTDGFLLSDSPNTGAEVFSETVSFYVPVRRGTAFDREIAAMHTALFRIQCHLEKCTRVVILSAFKVILFAIVCDNNPFTQEVLDCRQDIKNLTSLGKTIILQWVPAHCGVPRN